MRAAKLIWLLCLLASVNADNNEFSVPPPGGMEVTMDQIVRVKWRCDDCASDIKLSILQTRDEPPKGDWVRTNLLPSDPDSETYKWKAHTYEDLPIGNGFHFTLQYKDRNGDEKGFNSGSLRIVDVESSSSTRRSTSSSATLTWTTVSPTSSPSMSSLPSTSSSPSDISTADPTPTNTDDKLKVGLGAGLGIGIPLLLAGGLLGWNFFRRRAQTKQNLVYAPVEEHKESYQQAVEFRGSGQSHELPEYTGRR